MKTIGKLEKMNGYLMLKPMFYVQVIVMLDKVKLCKKKQDLA